ncbi:MAG: multidrug ABC transporter substrate-binding protein [Acidobacteria bacterium]|nr:MAG: multidrug ABC transporter substrate-binding protein [Acidobacteriota bacterium]REK03326.1 MAG: multidrug ABC transporter substrate-binding protein [Acidobacteriota bacterium]
MILLENLIIALSALRANLMRSLLTMLGVIIGVAAVIAVVSIVQGLQNVITQQFQSGGSNTITVVPFVQQGPSLVARQLKLTWEDGQAIRERVRGIEGITPLLVGQATAKYRENQHRPAQIFGVIEDYPEINNHVVERGRFLLRVDLELRRKVAVLGRTVVEQLELGSEAIGAEIYVGNVPVTVIGVMEERGTALGQDSDDLVFLPYDTAEQIFGRLAADRIFLQMKAESAEAVPEVRDGIERVLRERHGLGEDEENDFTIQVQDQLLETITSVIGSVTAVVAAVVGVALIVGGIGIMNIMLVSVTERTREIGLRKSVGATKRDVLLQFLIEAVVLSLVGGIIGTLLGWGIGALAAFLLPGDWPAAYVPWWAVAVAFGFCTLVGVVFGIYPAGKAAALDPIEALRYE